MSFIKKLIHREKAIHGQARAEMSRDYKNYLNRRTRRTGRYSDYNKASRATARHRRKFGNY